MPAADRSIPYTRRHMHEFVYPDYHEWPFPDTFDPAAHDDSALIPDVVKSPVGHAEQRDYPVSWDEQFYPHARLDTPYLSC
ncbi:MAG: hypothetical protein KGZ66_02420 [Selenomonadales bacterium]|nr:hypothetical protein [Selenomonadales bacterium]